MKSALTFIPIAMVTTSAATVISRAASCCFSLVASGSGMTDSTVQQLGDGQARIGQAGLTGTSEFCLGTNGGLTDSNGRGCILTPPTSQLQCDTGASPTTGFSVSDKGKLTYNGSPNFYACPTGQDGGENIYLDDMKGQKCTMITLSAHGKDCQMTSTSAPPTSAPKSTSGMSTMTRSSEVQTVYSTVSVTVSESCTSMTKPVTSYLTVTAQCPAQCHSSCPQGPSQSKSTQQPLTSSQSAYTMTDMYSTPPLQSPSSQSTPKPVQSSSKGGPSPTTTATGEAKACPTDLSGPHQTPHLIIPVNSSSPDTSYGTSYFATFSEIISTVFTFDIPTSYQHDTCSLVFLFPTQDQLQTSSYTMSGEGGLDFYQLDKAAGLDCSYSNMPGKEQLVSIQVQPGNSWVVSTGQCMAGEQVSVLVEATGSLSLRFFEDWNPASIGVFMTQC